MPQEIDFILDEDQDVIFKSSDGKLFSLCKARAMESKVWKDMLKLGQNQKEDQVVVSLSENSKVLLPFLRLLSPRDWLLETPEELQNLKADSFLNLVEASAKYDAEIVLVFVYWELKKKICPHFDERNNWTGFEEDGWHPTQIMKFFIVVQPLSHAKLNNVAAKLTLLIPGIVTNQSKEVCRKISFRTHIMPLYAFRKRWDQIKARSESHKAFQGPKFNFYCYGERALDRTPNISMSDRQSIRATARELDEALLNLEYKGLAELNSAEGKSK